MTLKAPLFQKTTLASCLLVSYFVSFFVPRVSGSAWIGSDTLWKQALTPACASPHIPSISYSTINQTTALQMHGTSPSSPPQPQGTPAVAPQAQPSQKMCHHQVPRANHPRGWQLSTSASECHSSEAALLLAPTSACREVQTTPRLSSEMWLARIPPDPREAPSPPLPPFLETWRHARPNLTSL